jgi:hypothetical protein
MVNVTDLGRAADKFERRGSQAGQDYQQGVQDVSDSEQQQATVDAADTWEQGVQEAITEGRFQAGASDPSRSWQQRSLEVGSSRFTQGVADSGDVWQERFSPFADVLEGLNLEPRGPRGSEANYNRSRAVGEALHNARQG